MYKENMDAELLCLECPYQECMNKASVRANCSFIRDQLQKRQKKAKKKTAPRRGK